MIPDFTHMKHFEVVIALLVKILAIAAIVLVIVLIYRDASASELSIRTGAKIAISITLTILSIVLVPTIFQVTYYGANRFMLQNEAARIAMFTTEKYQSGIEVGVTKTRVPINTNDLMIQLDWVNIPWYEYVEEMIIGQGISRIQQVRDQAYMTSFVANQPDVKRFSDLFFLYRDRC